MALMNLAISILILEVVWAQSQLEEPFLPASSSEDEDSYLMFDTRSEMDPKQSRRSTLDRNFARFGRGDLPPQVLYDYDPYSDHFPRPNRYDKTSDFVRFGRDGARKQAADKFVRFGRNVRNKREIEKRGGSNFVRFGRNDNFMRFGRDPEGKNKRREELLRWLMEAMLKEHPEQPTRLV